MRFATSRQGWLKVVVVGAVLAVTSVGSSPAAADDAPTVTITSPADGAHVRGTVSLTATASDDVGVTGVQFLLDGTTNIGANDTSAPYTRNWNTSTVPNGPHTVGARARDTASNSTTSTISVIVDNEAPAGTVVINNGAAVTNNRTVTLTLAATDALGPISQMRFSNSSTSFSGTRTYETTTSWTLSSGAGTKTVYVQFRDLAGNWSTASSSDSIVLDTTAPVISGRAVSGITQDTATITWTTDEPSTSQVDYGVTTGYGSTTPLDSALVTAHSVQVTGLAGQTTYNYRIRTRDAAGNERVSNNARFTTLSGPPDLTPPHVHITSPAPGEQVVDITSVTAEATDTVGVVGVQFLVDGVATGTEDRVAPYVLNWDTRDATNGVHTVAARARDAAGNTATSAPVSVNVANTNFFQNEILITGLDLPTTIEFLPDGRLLIAELQGTILVASPPYTSVSGTPFGTIANTGEPVQQGIMDLELDPDFANNHYYYVFYTAGTPNRDRLSRFTANESLTGTIAGSELILYEDPQNAHDEHHGGAVNFGNDGKIYFTTGEHFTASNAPLLTSPRGKIHRINPDGSVPTDNPFFDGAGPNVDSIWARGLRNPFRAYYDPPTGRLYIADVGGNVGSSLEEVNIGVAGANYGWPSSEGACAAPCTSPIYSYGHSGRDASITGGFVYRGTTFPSQYQGSYFFADYGQNWIRRLTLDANGNVTGVFNFEPADGSVDGPYGDIVDLAEGPDGALYYVDLGFDDESGQFGVSKIRRIRYVEQNQAPVAVAAAEPTSGPRPLTVTFSSAGSFDPEGEALSYHWTFGDGETSTEANPVHVYNQAGPYTARLEVSDGVNTTQAPPVAISVGNKPSGTIVKPEAGRLFRAGDVIEFEGTGTDTEDGPLPASAFTWGIDFLHEGHVHPGPRLTGVTEGSFTVPTSGHDFGGNTRYRITLTVTDTDGLQTSESIMVFPDKVNVTIATEPPGLTVNVDGIAHTTPFVHGTLIGFVHTIEAANQGRFAFQAWSDGGAQEHDITVPTAAATYTATYLETAPPLPPGAIAEWRLDEGANTQTADSSGNGHLGTLVGGAAWTTGRVGGAVQFDGTNDYVDTALESAFDFTGSFSVSFWMKRTGYTKAWEAMITKADSAWGVARNNTGRSVAFTTFNASGAGHDLIGTTIVDNNQWHHVVAVFTGTQKQLYIDGVLNASANYSQTLRTNNFNVRMGMNQEFATGFYGGALDQVRVYGRALSLAEVTMLFNE